MTKPRADTIEQLMSESKAQIIDALDKSVSRPRDRMTMIVHDAVTQSVFLFNDAVTAAAESYENHVKTQIGKAIVLSRLPILDALDEAAAEMTTYIPDNIEAAMTEIPIEPAIQETILNARSRIITTLESGIVESHDAIFTELNHALVDIVDQLISTMTKTINDARVTVARELDRTIESTTKTIQQEVNVYLINSRIRMITALDNSMADSLQIIERDMAAQ